jgi:hypothetical protein
MLHAIVAIRRVLAMGMAAAIGTWGLQVHPVDVTDPFLGLIEVRSPGVFTALVYGYVALWFTTPFFGASLLLSLFAILASRREPRVRARPLPTYVQPEDRAAPTLVLGERHFETTTGRSPHPDWLTIPRRGLYTGVMVVGAVGTGKTSACMYPYADQLLRWRSGDPEHKVGGLVLEVKGDFCNQVRGILRQAGRENDYLEIGLDSGVAYNPLHNDLEPYALAYAIASLLNNLFGKSKEPFWQQAYTDLLKFVILLRRITEGYTTLGEVYRYVLEESLIEQNITQLTAVLKDPPTCIIVSETDYLQSCAQLPWTLWFRENVQEFAHPYAAELDEYLQSHSIPARVAKTNGDAWIARRHQLQAIARWYKHGWSRLDNRLRSSITEGVVVFLSLFDDNQQVHDTFCPPRSAYAGELAPGQRRPLRTLEDLLETGTVLALNFPVVMNPGLARALGVMLKLDFQRAVLKRIPKIAAHPGRVWRDLVFICDEYHAFATVGETDPTGDERTFALSRQARLIPIVATQSISSLRSALPGDESWRTLMQCFRTKVFLATSDEFTAKAAAELCGRRDRLKAHYTLGEGGQNAHISLLTGRAVAAKHSLSASKSYAPHHEYIFPPRVFTELKNSQAIAIPYDGLNPLPPQFCYLKPHYLDANTSYFDHAENGAL